MLIGSTMYQGFVRLGLLTLFVMTLAACGTAREPLLRPEPIGNLPPVQEVDGELAISLAYPPPNQLRPNVDSTFVFGSVGTGRARLLINGEPVPVAPNGGFLAYVRVPRDGVYRLEAEANGARDALTYTYREPERRAPQPTPISPPRVAVVSNEGRDRIDTGSQTAHASATPSGERTMFMLPDTRVLVTGRLGDQLRIQLADGADAWMSESFLRLESSGTLEPPQVQSIDVVPNDQSVDVRLGVPRVPFVVRSDGSSTATLTLYRVNGATAPAATGSDSWLRSAVVSAAAPDSMTLSFDLAGAFWGYQAFFESDSLLVVRLRKTPEASGVRGLRILVDPGHPPGGAIGPTRLAEAEANLAIARELREMLEDRGADVIMIRETNEVMVSRDASEELWARVAYAVDQNADLLISVHNNAFPDGVNPFENHGSEVYYFNDFAEDLARLLVEEIAATTGIPNNGAIRRSLALARPTWMPAVLTESLYMMFPQQEAALRDPAFIRRLAEAHLRGIERFVEGRLR